MSILCCYGCSFGGVPCWHSLLHPRFRGRDRKRHLGARKSRLLYVEYDLMKRIDVKGREAGRQPGDWPDGDKTMSAFPSLASFLVDVVLDDGSVREKTGTLTISFWEGRVCGRLADRDQKIVCFVSAAALLTLFTACEKALDDPSSADWRKEKVWGATGGKAKRS